MQAASSERAGSAPSSCHHIRASQSGAEWATAAASGVESSSSRAAVSWARSRAARRSTALTRPGGMRCAGALDQLDRLVDGGVVGGAVGEEQLVEAEPQRGQHRRVEQPRRAAGQTFDRGVGGAAALDGAVGEPLGLGALAARRGRARSAPARKARSVKASRSKVSRIVSKASERAGAIAHCSPRTHGSFGSEWPRR